MALASRANVVLSRKAVRRSGARDAAVTRASASPKAALPVKVDKSTEGLCVNAIRFLAIDGVEAANSGHPGCAFSAIHEERERERERETLFRNLPTVFAAKSDLFLTRAGCPWAVRRW